MSTLAQRISVIIPVLNERELLPVVLQSLQYPWVHEVIVVDGGSGDGTREWLDCQNGIRVLRTSPGRGLQLNRGAQVASGDVLLFLHCDCQVSQDAGGLITSAMGDSEVGAGAFYVRFAEKYRRLRLVAAGINLRTRLTRSATGDQGIFVRRSVFDQVSGFPEWPLFEDVEFVRRVKQRHKFGVVPARITISGRRHLRQGVLRTVLLIYLLRLAYFLGASPFTLKEWFNDHRTEATNGRA